jgi:hypothetical protein
MRLWNWLSERFSARGKILARYKHGLSRARHHDHPGAIADYDAVIANKAASPDLISMARYNRALVNAAVGNQELAEHELRAVIAFGETPINVRTAARHKLARMNHPVPPRRA